MSDFEGFDESAFDAFDEAPEEPAEQPVERPVQKRPPQQAQGGAGTQKKRPPQQGGNDGNGGQGGQQRPQGQRSQGQRPQGQGQRPQGQGQRPQGQGQRPQGQGQRPQGQGQRPQGQGGQQRQQGQRPPQQGQGQRPQGQRPPQQGQGQKPQAQPQQQGKVKKVKKGNADPQMLNEQPVKPKKKGGILKILLIVVLLIVIVLVVMKVVGGKKEEPLVASEVAYDNSGKFAYDTLLNAIVNYDATALDAIVGTADGDSWLAKEWAYVNGVTLRQDFLKKIGSLVTFKYPTVQQMSTTGVGMTDAAGNPIMIESMMNGGESVTVTVPDYALLMSAVEEEQSYIHDMYTSYVSSRENAYREHDDMFNLMMQYLVDKAVIPTKEVELSLPIRLSEAGAVYIEDDAALDDLLFGNEDFRSLSEKFSQIATGWTGYKDEHYTEVEEQHNPEFDAWYEQFIVLYEADGGSYDPETHKFSGGHFSKGKSKWEPWYLRDDNNVIQKDENGENIVNYFSIKVTQENGEVTDWIQPDEIIEVEVDKTRQVEDPWVNESKMYYNNIGTHYIMTAYDGEGLKVTRVGDGSVEHPAGIGTTIVTKAVDANDEATYHDVEVALIGYWTEQDAIDYASRFSTRNRGFTVDSPVKLITYEMTVKNLEEAPITITSEMTLCDRNSNVTSRTGTMYEFKNESITIPAGKTVTINDWASSTELAQKYVAWGRSFGRSYPFVYFDCLAGTGEIPPYSAYKAFTGESVMEPEANGE